MARITGIRTHIMIGGFEIYRCPLCSIEYSRQAHLSRARVVASDPGGELFRTLNQGDPVEIRVGLAIMLQPKRQSKVKILLQVASPIKVNLFAMEIMKLKCLLL